MSATKQRHRRI